MKLKKVAVPCITVCCDASDPPAKIMLIPYGEVKSTKGNFIFDDEAAQELLARYENKKNDLVIDYEHQTLYNVQAPAAAWIKALEYRKGEGLFGVVEWTERGGSYVANKEYRYLSPVIMVRTSDHRAVALHSAALTNDPAIDGMIPLVAKNDLEDEMEDNMEFLKLLAQMLGLPETASETDVAAAVKALLEKESVSINKELRDLLEVDDKADINAIKGKIIAMKNPAGFVKVEKYQELQTQLAEKVKDELVTAALKDGKIAPAQKEWAETYALKDPEGFRGFLAMTAAGAVVPTGEVAGGEGVKPKQDVDDQEMLIHKNLGLTADDLKKYGKQEEK